LPGPRATVEQQYAQQYELCVQATATVDGLCNQILRATVDQEELLGPDERMTVDPNTGVAYVQTFRWPVRQVLGGQVSPATSFPPNWQTVSAANMRVFEDLTSLYTATLIGGSGAGSTRLEVAPGYVTWYAGRNGTRFQYYYINGWSHCGLTASCASGASTLQVDDVTNTAGTTLYISDGANSEYVSVASAAATAPVALPIGGSVQAGPGTLTLTGSTTYTHQANIILTELPQSIVWATAVLCAAEALTRGATATVVPSQPGANAAQSKGIGDYKLEAAQILAPYRRVI
jgi:hypothetical protein